MENPQFIGQGFFGCVYKPGFECQDPSINARHQNDVMKVLDSSNPVDALEQEIIDILKDIDPFQQYFIYTSESCKLNTVKFNKSDNCKQDYIEPIGYFMKNGGMSLSDIIGDGTNERNNKYFIDNMIYWIYDILLAIQQLQTRNIVHADIKWDNIVIDPETNTARLIDFGMSYKFADVHRSFYSKMFSVNPPFLNIDNEETYNIVKNEDISHQDKFKHYEAKAEKSYENLLGQDYLKTLYKEYDASPRDYKQTLGIEKFMRIDIFGLGNTFIKLLTEINAFPNKIDPRIKDLLQHLAHINPNIQYDVTKALEITNQIISSYIQEHARAQSLARAQFSPVQPSAQSAERDLSPYPMPARVDSQSGGHKNKVYRLKYLL